ncbi:MAG: Hint domain-containing protein, partial [Proteobacteria bacterium]|nr:Hint domain-containing protein [Pseudomonadota bacterium]
AGSATATTGVYIGKTGAVVTNTSIGTITGTSSGVLTASGFTASIVNAGQISGGQYGIKLASGGVVTNAASGTISGAIGLLVTGSVGTVVNAGVIQGTGGAAIGVDLRAGGVITNQATGAIKGKTGITVSGGAGTVVAEGTIDGTGGTAIALGAGFAHRVVLDPGANVFGKIDGGNTIGAVIASTLELAAGAVTGTVSGIGTQIVDFARITVDSGASWVLGGTNTVPFGVTLTDLGTLTIAGTVSSNFTPLTLGAGGVVTVGATGAITAVGYGALLTDASNTATNAGRIGGGLIGLYLTAGGAVTNLTGGTISGSEAGIRVKGGAGTVTNAGTITSAKLGVQLLAGGTVINQVGGILSSVDVSGGIGAMTNSGVVTGSGAAIAAVRLGNGGDVTNSAGGTISSPAGHGVALVQTGQVLNAGRIDAGNYGVFLQVGGFVTNSAGGTIQGTHRGIHAGLLATIVNSGFVNSGSYGIVLATGTVVNHISGTISGNKNAVVIGTGGGTLINAGQLQSSNGTAADFDNGGLLQNLSGGVVYGWHYGFRAASGVVTIDNSGTIRGSYYQGARIGPNVQSAFITNQASGLIESKYGGVLLSNKNGTLLNAGTIIATDASALGSNVGWQVTNQVGGLIASGKARGVIGGGTVVNEGSIAGPAEGVFLTLGGSVDNRTSGIIRSELYGVVIFGQGSVTNAGTIQAATSVPPVTGFGVYFYDNVAGDLVTNLEGGLISGAVAGVHFHKHGVVINAGTILATSLLDRTIRLRNGTFYGANGVNLFTGGVITNQAAGIISGQQALQTWGASSTLVNAGTIIGTSGTAAAFAEGFANRLIIDPGASFSGLVDGGSTNGGSVINTLELRAGGSIGAISGLGSQFVDFSQIVVDAGASWTFGGSNTIVQGTTLTVLDGAVLDFDTVLQNDGMIVIDPSTMVVFGLTGTGTVTIDEGSVLEVQGTVAASETIAFSGTQARLDLDDPVGFAGLIQNFMVGDTITLDGVNPATVSYDNGFLTFGNGYQIRMTVAQPATVQAVATATGTDVLGLLCFCEHTRLLTPDGEQAVEDLSVGDLVTTWRGEHRRIVWIGTSTIPIRRGRRDAATPVIVQRDAIAPGVPRRPLRVTKGHSLLFGDVLIPVEYLVNHRSIRWDDHAQMARLYHIELETHDVLVADGAPAESYRDDGNRWLFSNANSAWGLPPKPPCAPVLTGGAVVDAVWRRLLERSGVRPGMPLTSDADVHLLVDGARVDAVSVSAGKALFRMAGRPGEVRLCSRSGAPQELGLARDPRMLGVGVRRIVLWQGHRPRVLEADDSALSRGFHPFEPDNGYRWTDGDAVLPSTLFDGVTEAYQLEVHLAGTAQYPLLPELTARAA